MNGLDEAGSSATPLWQPSEARIRGANVTALIAAVNDRWNAGIGDYNGLYAWSIAENEKFWLSVIDFAGLKGRKPCFSRQFRVSHLHVQRGRNGPAKIDVEPLVLSLGVQVSKTRIGA